MTAYDPRLNSLLAALGRGGDNMVAHINPQEAALLKALGGSGKINPNTGLPEFDGGGGSDSTTMGGYNPNPPAAGPAPTVPTGGPDLTTYLNQQSYASSYNDPAWSIPSNAIPLDPSVISMDAASRAEKSGITSSPFGTDPQFIDTPGNPYYTTNASGYGQFTPQGQAAYNAWDEAQKRSIDANDAKNAAGIAGFLGTPMGAISVLGFPLAIGGGVAALGGIGGALDAGGGAAAAGAAGAGEAAGAGSPLFLGATESQALDSAALGGVAGGAVGDAGSGIDAAALAFDNPSIGAGAATAGGAGVFGGATPELADLTLAESGLGAAQISDQSLNAALAFDNPTVGAGGATTGGAGLFGGATPELADASLFSSGLTDINGNALSGLSTTPFASASSDPSSLFLGATQSQSVDPATVGATGGAVGDAGSAGTTGGLGTGAGGDVAGGTAGGSGAGFVDGGEAGAIDGTEASPGILRESADWLGNQFSKAGDWLGTQFDKNPLGILGSAVGIGASLLKKNSTPPQATALQGQANALTAQGQTIANQVLSGTNPLPGATQLQTIASNLTQQSKDLLAQVQSGNLPNVGAPQLLAQGNLAAQQAATLHSYLMTGTLPPGIQAGVDAAAAAAKASIRSAYASRGMSGSSSEAQDISNVDVNKAAKAADTAMQLYAQGTTESQIADGVYTSLVNASTAVMQLGITEQSLGLQAQQDVTQSASTLLNFALNSTSLGANISQVLLQEELQRDQQLQNSLAQFSAALAGGTTKIALVQSGATTTTT